MLREQSPQPDRASLGEVFRRRLEQLGRSGNWARMDRESGVGELTWRALIEKGRAPTRGDKRAGVCRYANWPPTALDDLQAGADPATLKDIDELDPQAVEIKRLWAAVAELQARLGDREGDGE